MASTPIYNWPTPDNTDLVKNGALAIRTLGNAIDTTTATLVPKSLVDAKGDLFTATANDTPAKLAVGADGETLVADSSTATGLRYQSPVNANPVLNSAFQIAQRGTSIPNTGSFLLYTLDRWQFNSDNSGRTVSRQLTGDTTNLPFVQFCARVARDAGVTDTTDNRFAQSFESVNSIPFANKTVVLSFFARKGANYSATSNILKAQVISGTGTDQSVITGFTGANVEINGDFTLTNTWQRFTIVKTGQLSNSLTQLAILFASTLTGTAGAADYYEITGVQLEVGFVATPFKTNGGTIQGETSACQRYFYKATNPFLITTNQNTTSTTGILPFLTEMRVAPTATYSAASSFYVSGNSSGTASSVGTNTAKTFQLAVDFGRSSLTAFNSSFISNNGTSSIEVSSEL